jgi:hypothetical protein
MSCKLMPFSYIVYIGILIFYGTFIYFFLPETKGLSAEAAAEVFDGPRASVSEESAVETLAQQEDDAYEEKMAKASTT